MRKTVLLAAPLIVAIVVTTTGWFMLVPRGDPLPLPPALVDAASDEGRARLAGAEAAADYVPLDRHYEPQILTSYCGVASSVAVLSALGLPATQGGFFTGSATNVRPRWRVALTGMPLDDLGGLLSAHGAKVTVHHADGTDADGFRKALASNLSRQGDYLIVNYQRGSLGQTATGHISPVAAYDADTDSALVMDTAAHKYPRSWVPVAALFDAMNTVDGETGTTRGYVEVSRPSAAE